MHERRECRKEGEEAGTQKWDKVYLTLKLFKTSENYFLHTCVEHFTFFEKESSSHVNVNEEF